MKVKIGSLDQLYGDKADPEDTSEAIRDVFDALKNAGVDIRPVYTSTPGPDVWFEFTDPMEQTVRKVVSDMSIVGKLTFEEDHQMGKHLSIPIILRRRRRWLSH